MNRTANDIMTDLVAAANVEDQEAVEAAAAELHELPEPAERAEDGHRQTRAEAEAAGRA